MTTSNSKLNTVRTNRGSTAPDDSGLSRWLWRHRSVLKSEVIFLEEAAGCCTQTQREDGSFGIRHAVWDRCWQDGLDNAV